MQDSIHVLLGTNDRYLPGATVTMASCIFAAPKGTPFAFHVMDLGLSADNRKALLDFFLRFPAVDIDLRKINLSVFENCRVPEFSGGGYAAYARLLAPSFLDLDRIIYIDTDILVQKDLREVWQENLNGKAFAACLNTSKISLPNCDLLSFDCPFSDDPTILKRPYFNTGFMVINLESWRLNDLTARAIDLLKLGKDIRYADQTVINFLLSDKAKILPSEWNTIPWWTKPLCQKSNLHFTSSAKPWTDRSFLPAERIWFDFYNHEIKPYWDPVRTTRHRIRGTIRFLRHYGIPALMPQLYCWLRKRLRNDSPNRRKNDFELFTAMHRMLFCGLDGTTRQTLAVYNCIYKNNGHQNDKFCS